MLTRALLIGVLGAAANSSIAWAPFIPDPILFHSVSLAMIAAIYMGFAFSDGRPSIVILELAVGGVFITLALLGVWASSIFIAVGLVLHGLWDLAHRPGGVGTKLPAWYPPFCAAYDFVFAGVFLALARQLATHAS
jgi:hypothetical protein